LCWGPHRAAKAEQAVLCRGSPGLHTGSSAAHKQQCGTKVVVWHKQQCGSAHPAAPGWAWKTPVSPFEASFLPIWAHSAPGLPVFIQLTPSRSSKQNQGCMQSKQPHSGQKSRSRSRLVSRGCANRQARAPDTSKQGLLAQASKSQHAHRPHRPA